MGAGRMKGAGGARSARRQKRRAEERRGSVQRPGVGTRGSTLSDADSTTDSGAAGLQKKLESARVATAVKGGSQAAEASGENIFMVKDGVVYTPPLTSPILAGITRDTVLVHHH